MMEFKKHELPRLCIPTAPGAGGVPRSDSFTMPWPYMPFQDFMTSTGFRPASYSYRRVATAKLPLASIFMWVPPLQISSPYRFTHRKNGGLGFSGSTEMRLSESLASTSPMSKLSVAVFCSSCSTSTRICCFRFIRRRGPTLWSVLPLSLVLPLFSLSSVQLVPPAPETIISSMSSNCAPPTIALYGPCLLPIFFTTPLYHLGRSALDIESLTSNIEPFEIPSRHCPQYVQSGAMGCSLGLTFFDVTSSPPASMCPDNRSVAFHREAHPR
mmetsp:Transcript_22668/g.46197  ORF Transcript_22668/g.46197 Transcript_22668/m.46197 type:complete len:270 (-) Transcript_22668:57-866(-)